MSTHFLRSPHTVVILSKTIVAQLPSTYRLAAVRWGLKFARFGPAAFGVSIKIVFIEIGICVCSRVAYIVYIFCLRLYTAHMRPN